MPDRLVPRVLAIAYSYRDEDTDYIMDLRFGLKALETLAMAAPPTTLREAPSHRRTNSMTCSMSDLRWTTPISTLLCTSMN